MEDVPKSSVQVEDLPGPWIDSRLDIGFRPINGFYVTIRRFSGFRSQISPENIRLGVLRGRCSVRDPGPSMLLSMIAT